MLQGSISLVRDRRDLMRQRHAKVQSPPYFPSFAYVAKQSKDSKVSAPCDDPNNEPSKHPVVSAE